MNKYNTTVIAEFSSPTNYNFLKNELMNKWPKNAIYIHNFINTNMKSFIHNFVQLASKSLLYNPINNHGESTRYSLADHVAQLNIVFVKDRTQFIKDYFVCCETARSMYSLTDSFGASTRSIIYAAPRNVLRDNDTSAVERSHDIYGASVVDNTQGSGSIGGDVDEFHESSPVLAQGDYYKRMHDGKSVRYYKETDGVGVTKSSADAILESWRYPSHGATTRDDIVGDYGIGNMFSGDSKKSMASRSRANCPRAEYGGEYFQGGNQDVENGLVSNIFDSTGDIPIGTYNHQDMLFNDPKVRQLNDGYNNQIIDPFCARPLGNVNKFWASGSSFVDESDPAALDRMLASRTFKTYPRGDKICDSYSSINAIWTGELTNNQTPWYEKSLYNRHHDRDVDESIGGFERGYLNYGYNMSGLRSSTFKFRV